MTSIKLTDDLNTYLNKKSNDGLSSYFRQEYFVPNSINESVGTWFSSKETEESSSSWFAPSSSSPYSLSRTQRMIGFVVCLVAGFSCFGMASLYLPFLLLKARKFSLLFSLGSVFVLSAFSFLRGPWENLKHLFSRERLPFSITYLSTLLATVYFAVVTQSTVLTVPCALAQVLALAWYVASYVPGGQRGLNFLTKMCWKTASKTMGSTLPV